MRKIAIAISICFSFIIILSVLGILGLSVYKAIDYEKKYYTVLNSFSALNQVNNEVVKEVYTQQKELQIKINSLEKQMATWGRRDI